MIIKVWTSILAVLGFGTYAYADCYEQGAKLITSGVNSKGQQILDYCADSDLSKISAIEEAWPFLMNNDDKIKMATQYKSLTRRLKINGYNDLLQKVAAGRCEVCVVE